MRKWLWLAAAICVAAAAIGLWWAAQNPAWVAALAAAAGGMVWNALFLGLKDIFKPASAERLAENKEREKHGLPPIMPGKVGGHPGEGGRH